MIGGIQNSGQVHSVSLMQHQRAQQINEEALPIKNSSPLASKELLNKLVDHLNTAVAGTTHVKFELYDQLHEYYVKVIDDQTQEVIKEIPSKKALDMYAAMKENFGLFIDKHR